MIRHQYNVRLRCPECHDAQALSCLVWREGDHVQVDLLGQACACDVYANWDDVWEQALELAREGGLH